MRVRGRESMGELASGVVEDAQKLVRLEIELAKSELKEMAIRNGVAAGLLLVALLLIMITVLIAGPVIALVLLPWHWQVALIWGGGYLVLGAVLAFVGVKLFKPKPQRTMESFQETKEWFGDLTSSLGR